MSRPELLFPLFADLTGLPGVGPKTARNFAGVGVETPRDLLFTLPQSGIERRRVTSVAGQSLPAVLTVEVLIGRHFAPATRGRPHRVEVQDAQTSFQLVFFHARGDWLARQLPSGQRRVVSGRVELFDGIAQMVHPDHMEQPGAAEAIPTFEAVYPLAAGLTQKGVARAAAGTLARLPELSEWADATLVQRQDWPDIATALARAHAPAAPEDLSPANPSRRRLAYDECFAHQLTLAIARQSARKSRGRATLGDGTRQQAVRAALGYRPTDAQDRAVAEIAADMAEPRRMNRLLQGDVGSGKTFVALMALLIAVESGGQGVMMAPTEILARQHQAVLTPLAETAGVRVALLTGRDKGGQRAAKMADLAAGRIDILVGTHAVFQADVAFHDLRLAIIDEQHRFGVRERLELGQKGRAADMLVMTATPIPRSLALAQYGDMDVSVLDEKPPGRTPVTTSLVSAGRMDEVVERLRGAIAQGRQAYWVCPLVGESELVDLTAAEERFKRLRAALGEGRVGLVHGQLPPTEKDSAMAAFADGRTAVLVATTAIEVGVDVPNASIMVIERAENFGLAQLHQLRGRVGRGSIASTCLLMYQPPLTEGARRRLEVLRETEDGFRIAEVDLEMRGAGDVIGTAQSGLPRFRIADLERDQGLLALAQTDARKLLADDPHLSGPRGQAARLLLWLMEQDKAFRLLSVG